MTIETNGRRIAIDIDPLLMFILLGDKVDKKIVSDIAKPDFSIVVRPTKSTKFKNKEGDYVIVVRKDNGEEKTLDMPHRGAKMFYILTLLCQKAVNGLSNIFFKNEQSAELIKSLYNKLYRSGGVEWVSACAENNHNLSTFRTHANNAVKDNNTLDNMVRYWCGIEDEKRTIGNRNLQLRRIRIPNDRILFEDSTRGGVSFNELISQLSQMEDLFSLKNRTTERMRELRLQRAESILPHS